MSERGGVWCSENGLGVVGLNRQRGATVGRVRARAGRGHRWSERYGQRAWAGAAMVGERRAHGSSSRRGQRVVGSFNFVFWPETVRRRSAAATGRHSSSAVVRSGRGVRGSVGWRGRGVEARRVGAWRSGRSPASLAINGATRARGRTGVSLCQFLSRTTRGEAVGSWRRPGHGGTARGALGARRGQGGEEGVFGLCSAFMAWSRAGDRGARVVAQNERGERAGNTEGVAGCWAL